MFFILKDEKTVIAADNAFMEKAGVESIYLLAELFRVGEFPLNEADNTCHIDGQDEVFTKIRVQTMSGEAFVYDFSQKSVAEDEALLEKEARELPEEQETLEILETTPEEVKTPSPFEEKEPSTDEEALELLEEPEPLEHTSEASAPLSKLELPELEEEAQETDTTLAEASLGTAAAAGAAVLLSEDEETPLKNEEAPKEKEDIFELIDLGKEEQEPKAEEEEPLNLSEPSTPEAIIPIAEVSAKAPFADYEQNAQLIGISSEEYAGFLSQFVDESLEHESDLKGNDLRLFRENITSLKDASQLLHLPKLTDNLHETEEATSEEKATLLDDFFAMLQHIQADLKGQSIQTAEPQIHPETTGVQRIEKETTTPESKESLPSPAPHSMDTESILDHITPLPFDFSAHVAADELGLPESLVEEFVIDFVKQAKENIPVFEQAQQNGDMETVQKTAHLLKGAASNLRIDPLAKTLEELQHNEDATKIPDLFQRFVGQLRALDNFIHAPGM